MAKCWCGTLFYLHLSFVVVYTLSDTNDDDYHHYNIDTIDSSPHDLHLRIQRDVDPAQAVNVTTSSQEKNDVQKKPTSAPKKDEIDKFPNTKKPVVVIVGKPGKLKPIKIDKNPKKPLGKPDEKPDLKPNGEEREADNSASNETSPVVFTTTSSTSTTPLPTVVEDGGSNTTTIISSDGVNSSNNSTTYKEDLEIAKDDDGPLNGTIYTNNTSAIDHHRYYKSLTYSGDEMVDHYWVNLPENISTESILLSSAHRQAFTLSLSFYFPFYGHLVRNITIATGGFLYTGEILHTWLAATQYIAPLMANFDTSSSKESKVKYADNGTALTVQWENVQLKEKLDGGFFTFQVTIHSNGDIVFSYKDIPVAVNIIADGEHPVKVGLSDAYIVQKTIFYVRRKTIYEYHKIDMKKPEKVSNWTAILFKALPTCVSFSDCNSCLTQNTSFQCRWCEKVSRCSDGMDRHRQEWLLSRCDFFNTDHPEKCVEHPAVVNSLNSHDTNVPTTLSITKGEEQAPSNAVPEQSEALKQQPTVSSATTGKSDDEAASGGVGAGVTVAILVCLLLCVVGWVAYAYLFPHTTSGQLLIKHRPSTWSFKRGGARYTAAAMHSIHM